MEPKFEAKGPSWMLWWRKLYLQQRQGPVSILNCMLPIWLAEQCVVTALWAIYVPLSFGWLLALVSVGSGFFAIRTWQALNSKCRRLEDAT